MSHAASASLSPRLSSGGRELAERKIFRTGPVVISCDEADGRKRGVFFLCYLTLAPELAGALTDWELRLVDGGRSSEKGLGLLPGNSLST